MQKIDDIVMGHTLEFESLFKDEHFKYLLRNIAPCISMLLSANSICELDDNMRIGLLKFATICLHYLHYILKQNVNIFANPIEDLLTAADVIFQQTQLLSLFDLKENLKWFCTSANTLFYLTEKLLKSDKPLPCVPNYFPKNVEDEQTESEEQSDDVIEMVPVSQSVHKLFILVTWFFNLKCINRTRIPQFLFEPIRSLTVSLSRTSLANSYVMVPLKAWKTGWVPEALSGTFPTQVPAIPIEILQDVEVLEEYIFR